MRPLLALIVVCGCVGSIGSIGGGVDAATEPDSGTTADSGQPEQDAGPLDAGPPDAGPPDAGPPDAGPPDAGDFCGTAKLCETFESYDAGRLSNGNMIGPWRVTVQGANATANIDTTRSVSGTRAFHVHLDMAASSGGGQLKTRAAPLFATPRQQLYGRFMMYLGPDGTCVHWTMWGASGTVPAGTTSAGANATYLFSAFDNGQGKNIFSDVYGNSITGQDCYHGSQQLMPVNRWACVEFSVDGPAIKYRMSLDKTPVPSMSIDQMGDGCVGMGNQKWWGPDFQELYLGALTFHPMTGPLDLWIDDIVVDTSPVVCP